MQEHEEFGISADEFKLLRLFSPYDVAERLGAKRNKRRFVHYTSAAAAISIIQSQEIWLRNAMVMNDSSEIQHGMDAVASYFNGESGVRFWNALDSLWPESSENLKNLLDNWASDFLVETYISCLSMHRDNEDEIGRLSMWRAYGGSAGIALVLNPAIFYRMVSGLGAYSSPACYRSQSDVARDFDAIIDGIEENIEFLSNVSHQKVLLMAFRMFQYYSTCLKHPGFEEELEWRIVHRPSQEIDTIVHSKIHVISDVPQKICVLPLKDDLQKGIVGISLPSILDRVIIGPARHPEAIWSAIVEALDGIGVERANEKVFISSIPLRT